MEQRFNPAEAPMEMMALGLMLLAAHLGGKLFRRLKLSEVTGQLLGGACVGPYVLHLIGVLPGRIGGPYDDALHAFHFFIFMFLGLIAFGIGEELHFSRLKKVGRSATIICFIQALTTWACISCGFYFLGHEPLLRSLLLGSVGIATAPAATFVMMNQLRIEGRLRHILGSLVVLDDLIEVVIFSLLIQLSMVESAEHAAGGWHVVAPVAEEVVLALLVGGAIYLALRLLVGRHARVDEGPGEVALADGDRAFLRRMLAEHPSPTIEIFLIVAGVIGIGAGFAYHMNWPFLVTATFAGFLVANYHSHAIFDSLKLENISPLLNLSFFALVGASMSLEQLHGNTAWLAGLYILCRAAGKILGTWGGCKIMREDDKITSCLPGLMLPQAGVAAVEAVYAAAVLKAPEVTAIILPAIVVFEAVGIYLADRGLRKWLRKVRTEEAELRRRALAHGPAKAAHLLLAHLPEEAIRLHLKANGRREVLEELIDHARHISEDHIDRAQALQVLGERERLTPTGMGNGIAIPHCRLMGLDKPVLVLGCHDTGIEYGAVDNRPVDLFLLILSSARDPAQHLQLLQAVAHVLGHEEIRQAIRQAKDSHGIMQLLHKLSESHLAEAERAKAAGKA